MTRSFLLDQLEKRHAQMGQEFLWAMGVQQPASFTPPPEWVRKVILHGMEGNPVSRAKEDADPMKAIMHIMGVGSGMADATRVFLEAGASEKKSDGSAGDLDAEYLKRLAGPLSAQVKAVDKATASLSKKFKRSSVADVATMSAAHSQGTAYVLDAVEGEDSASITAELRWLFWVFWPQLATASSIQKAHEWVADFGIIHCSQKLTEKFCREIQFKGSSRGRKRRIPTKQKKP